MKGRGLVVVLALVLATLATAGVFLYARGVKEEAKTGGTLVQVIVSKVDIPASSDLNELIKDKKFTTIEVPESALVQGAVTSIDQLADQHNSVAILAGEQIPTARISGVGTVPGGSLGIPEGMEAVNISLESAPAVAGALVAGDHVVIYVTMGSPKGGTPQATSSTVTLVPDAQILRVYQAFGASTVPGSQQAQQAVGNVAVTLALSPEDTQRFVFSMENGSVWLGLLPPGQNGKKLKPISFAQVLK